MNRSLQDKVVLITGASLGIGKALAFDALARGARVAVCARDIGKLNETFKNVPEQDIFKFQLDVADEQACYAFVAQTINKFGKIDVLLNNAGMSMRALFEDLDVKVLKQLMDVNFWGTVYMTKAALPYIKRSKGVILGVSSIAGYRGLPGRTGYSSSKYAMQGFMEALRTELLRTGVHVMWVCPGYTTSNIRNTALGEKGQPMRETNMDESKMMSPEACARIILDGVEKRKRTIIMTTQGKLTVWVNKLFGGLADKLVYKHYLKEGDLNLPE
ncbi:MAG: short chain dehydrogenase [Bacteroidetes bacterium 47-18]|nr:MAG: short chain dehydrogenase [Bacteroidetes bacterium 47-18]